jgi:pimeloyl-ACP methyl ester carboxylesterase
VEQFVDLGDVTLFVRQLGTRSDQPSLLVLHGGPDVGHSYLLPGLEAVARDRHVVTFDFRGCGRSTRGLPDAELEPAFVIRDAHRLIGELGLGQVDLLGFSTGGRAAMEFVSQHPADVRRLVLASTSAYPSDAARQYLDGWPEYEHRQRLEREADGALRNSTVFVWNLDLAPAYLDLIRDLDEGDWSFERVLDGTMPPWCTRDPVTILNGWAGPILILHGAKDMGFPIQLAHRLHRDVPASYLAVIDDAAHMCQFEKPGQWAKEIAAFLTGPVGLGQTWAVPG